jgi:hypothetical protein
VEQHSSRGFHGRFRSGNCLDFNSTCLMQPLSLEVFSFEQTAQASTCQTFQRSGVTQVRCHAKKWRTSRRLVKRSALAAANLISQHQSASEDFKMSLETILIIVLIVFLLGGGGWYWGRGRK